MTNHPNRSNAAKLSIQFCEDVFSKVTGRAHIKLGGEIAGFDRTRREVFVRRDETETTYMPAGSFMKYLSDDEIASLRSLPVWDGSNERELSFSILSCSTKAIRRFKGQKVRASNNPDALDYFDQAPAFIESVVDGKVQRSPILD
jgi:hypothetical protein